MSISQLYSIDNLYVRVKCEDKWITDRIPNLLKALGFIKGRNGSANTQVSVEFTSYNSKKSFPIQSSCLSSVGPLNLLQDNGYLYVTDSKSHVGVDLRTNSGFAILHDSFWQKPLYFKASLFIAGFILLFWQYDFHELHAAGLAKEGKGLLLVGSCSSGKSTLALSLVRQGWHYLSDDMLILRHTYLGVEALSLRRYFKINHALTNRYPELTHLLNKPLDSYEDEKCIYIDEAYANQFTQGCMPRVIIFPRINHKEISQIEPIKQSEALMNLFQSNFYQMYFDHQILRGRLEIMKELLYQTDCYQMSVGLDLYKDPKKIVELLPRF